MDGGTKCDPYYQDDTITLLLGDAATVSSTLEPQSIQTVVTSPPYFGLRDYGVDGQLGAEESPSEFVANLVAVFEALRPALRDDGVLWVNLGDSYSTYAGNRGASTGINANRAGQPWQDAPQGAGLSGDRPAKNLLGIPWRFAFAMQDAGWILRNDIIWAKPNGMPSSVTDRFTMKHEHLFLFAKSPRYYFDLDAVRKPLAPASVVRLSQDVENQLGSTRTHGGQKTNGNMKAAGGGKTWEERKAAGAPSRQGNLAGGVREPGGFAPGRMKNENRNPRHANATDNTGWKDHEPEDHPAGANPGDWWEISTKPFKGSHFAVFPPEIPERCILASTTGGGSRV